MLNKLYQEKHTHCQLSTKMYFFYVMDVYDMLFIVMILMMTHFET
jgi:hypothetical protein